MTDPHKILAVLGLTAICGILASIVVWTSPSPMPAGHAQLLAALIALFTAGGYALLRALSSKPEHKP